MKLANTNAVIPSMSFAARTPIKSDGVHLLVNWGATTAQKPSTVVHTTVEYGFQLINAKLYGFSLLPRLFFPF